MQSRLVALFVGALVLGMVSLGVTPFLESLLGTQVASLLAREPVGSRTAGADDPVSVAVRYNREIVRIFERKCTSCHADDGLAIPLASYHDVRPWAQAIREEILERRMPPWPAAPGVRPLANELALTTREIAIITAWIDGGTPRGEPSDLPSAKPRARWRAGEPSLTFDAAPQQVISDGNAYVRRVTLTPALSDDQWLRGFDVVPGARQALRSAFLYSKDAGREQWLGAWTPSYAMTAGPDNVGFKVAKGASLEVELHYARWDEPERTLTDASIVGLYLHPEPPDAVVEGLTISATTRTPKEGARGEAVLAHDTVVWAIRPTIQRDGVPEMGSLELRAILPDGRTEPMLWITDNRPDWQLAYILREPLRLPERTRIALIAHGESITSAHVSASLLTHRAATPNPSAEQPVRTLAPRRPAR